jgi:hypothetical protein
VIRPWARFTLDYVRPSLFAEEATRELAPFAGHFGGVVIDSVQSAPTSYTAPMLLKNWETGNREVCGPYSSSGENVARFVLPRRTLLATWQWNYRRKALQDAERDGLFVPKVLFIQKSPGIATAVIWPDAMPIRVPKVDYVIFSRERLAPRGLVGHRSDVVVAPWRDIAELVTGDAYYDSPLVSWRVTDPHVLTGLARRVAGLAGPSDMPDLLSPDKVLDREGFAPEPS